MFLSIGLLVLWTLNYGVVGEDRTDHLYTVVGVNCICTDTGVCNCKAGECGCSDCTVNRQPIPATPAAKRARTIMEFAGYVKVCRGKYCELIPTYRTVEVEE